MMQREIIINPLDVFGLRQLDYCPPHFHIVRFDLRVTAKEIENWIYENLSGRFYLGNYIAVDSDSTMSLQKIAAFELHEEASYFGLFLPNINVNLFNDPF